MDRSLQFMYLPKYRNDVSVVRTAARGGFVKFRIFFLKLYSYYVHQRVPITIAIRLWRHYCSKNTRI